MNFLKALQCLKGQRLHVSHHFLTAVEIVYSSKVSSNLIQSHLLNIWAAEKEKKIRKKKTIVPVLAQSTVAGMLRW